MSFCAGCFTPYQCMQGRLLYSFVSVGSLSLRILGILQIHSIGEGVRRIKVIIVKRSEDPLKS